jgi:hypothetical protein
MKNLYYKDQIVTVHHEFPDQNKDVCCIVSYSQGNCGKFMVKKSELTTEKQSETNKNT